MDAGTVARWLDAERRRRMIAAYRRRALTGTRSEMRRDAVPIVAFLMVLLAWDFVGVDLPLAHWYGNAQGFIWREHWLTAGLMHVGVKYLAWAAFGVLAMGFWRPLPFMRRLTPREHAWWIGTTLLCVALIALLKRVSVTSCPWDLVEFGGALARHVPHWALGQCDGGPGRCFPSAHASCAFAFLSVPFVLRRTAPVAATRMATLIVAAGLVFGWVQMMRGAHYASHTLWTGWFCWCISALSFHASRVWLDGTAARPRCAGCPAGSTVSSRQATPLHGSVMLSRRDATPLDHNARRPDPADTHATVARRRRQDDRGDRS